MSLDHALRDALRVAVILGLALAAMPLLRRAPAATRRLVLALALAGALVMPLASALAPAGRVAASPSGAAPRGVPELEALVEGSPALPVTPGSRAIAAAPPSVPASLLGVDPALAFAVVWALGALLVVARLAVGVLRSRAMVRRATAAPSWARAVTQAERATGLRADVRATSDLDAPAVTGVLSAVVLVPEGSSTWTDERRVAVLLHELAHVRQHDCLAQILAQLACAAHWFDPLAWVAARRLRLERELSADDAVIAAGARASSYAEDLLAIATARAVPAATLGMAERSQLAARITAIVSSERARLPLSRPRAALLVAGSAGIFGAIACAAPGAPPPQAPAPAPLAAASTAATAAPAPSSATSTIDPRLQKIAEEELERTVTEWQAATGAIVVIDPATGEILASAGRAGGAPSDVAVQQAYLTGSTLKPITLAAALDDGTVAPGDRFDCENGARAYGPRILHDSTGYGVLSLPEMLAVSTNVGFSKVFDRLGGARLDHWLRRFHFGVAPPLGGAVAGEMPAIPADRSFEGATLAIGEAMTASPVQLAAAYAALANSGVYNAPTLSRRTGRAPGEPLVRPETARAVVTMLEEAVNGERATGKAARIAGVRVAGKTGSAEWPRPGAGDGIYTSFVGIVPVEHPRFVVVVGIEAPRAGGSGGTVAAPAFARVVSRALGG
jgi:beta-lactamase regulating signal transducer with metallopeptidase domain